MNYKIKGILIFLLLGLSSNLAYGTFRTPYELREVKFSKKPKLDEWCTIKIKIICEGEPTKDALPLKITSPGIQTDLPDDQLPTWNDIKNGSVYEASFKIRPYFYGCSIMTVSSAGGGVFIGINDKGKSSFAGTSTELNKILGPWEEVIGYDINGNPVHEPSESQKRMQEKILSGYLNDGIKIISNKKGILKSIRGGGGNILRYDFYLSPLPEWGKKTKLKIRLVTRKEEPPRVEVIPSSERYFIAQNIPTFKHLGNGIITSEIAIRPVINEGYQGIGFKFIYEESDTSFAYGIRLKYDEQGKYLTIGD